LYEEIVPGGSRKYTDFIKGRFDDPDTASTLAYIEKTQLSINNWADRYQSKIVLWGWHPSELNTMAFEHESLKRLFVALGYVVLWISGSVTPERVLPELKGPKIFITGDGLVGAPIVPFVGEEDIVIVHNENNPGRWKGKLIEYSQYWVPKSLLAGTPTPYPTDLLPHEINQDWLDQKDDELAFFVGSQYNKAFQQQHSELRALLAKHKIDYQFLETWDCKAIHQQYIKARWMPVVQLPEMAGFLPSRFCKGMAPGCIPLSINPINKEMLGKAAAGCIFGENWPDVIRQVAELREDPKSLREKSATAMRWAMDQSPFHFLEYLWPAPERTPPSEAYWSLKAAIAHADAVVQQPAALEKLLNLYPKNFILMNFLGKAYAQAGQEPERVKLAREYSKLFPEALPNNSWAAITAA
jgi:hypothetical protein